MTGRHRTVGRHRACRKRVSMWPRLGFIGALAVATAGPALIFNIAVGPDAYANPPALSSAITNSSPAALPVLAAPSRGGFYTVQPRVDLMVRQVYAAIVPTHDGANSGGGGGSEGGSHNTSSHDTASHDTSSHDTNSHDNSDTGSNTDHHHSHDTGSDTTPSQPPGCH
jgi:hypothetical protein